MMLESQYGLIDNKRTRQEIAITQELGDAGNLSLSAYSQDYWHSQSSDKTLHAGFYSA